MLAPTTPAPITTTSADRISALLFRGWLEPDPFSPLDRMERRQAFREIPIHSAARQSTAGEFCREAGPGGLRLKPRLERREARLRGAPARQAAAARATRRGTHATKPRAHRHFHGAE